MGACLSCICTQSPEKGWWLSSSSILHSFFVSYKLESPYWLGRVARELLKSACLCSQFWHYSIVQLSPSFIWALDIPTGTVLMLDSTSAHWAVFPDPKWIWFISQVFINLICYGRELQYQTKQTQSLPSFIGLEWRGKNITP